LEKEFADVRAEVESSRQDANPKTDELARLRDTEIRSSVEGVSIDSVAQRISGLSIEITKSLAGVSEQLIEEVRRLTAIREAVELEKRDLQRLHQIDVAAASLDQLVQDYARKREEFEQETAAQRAEWKEQEENLRKQRARELEDFEYKKALERKKAQDKYDEDIRLRDKKNQEKQESLEKTWQAREAAIKEQEEEIARLRDEAAKFPSRLQAEMEHATAEAVRQTEARFEQRVLVLQKDAEADKRLADLRIKTLEETLAQQTAQIATLQKQLDQAKQQVQDIALKAIEGASGSKTLAHINQIAMEQAKHRSPQG
jgi:colicin import membrane protein